MMNRFKKVIIRRQLTRRAEQVHKEDNYKKTLHRISEYRLNNLKKAIYNK